MKKKILGVFVLTISILLSGFVFSSCSTDFWDGFVYGYNSTRYSSNDSGYIFDRVNPLDNQ